MGLALMLRDKSLLKTNRKQHLRNEAGTKLFKLLLF